MTAPADDAGANLAEVADELYGLDPAEFIPARNELVRRLRKDAKRELATRVAALRRPSPAAWAVNQLARHRRADIDDLLHLGDALRAAQSHTLAGAGASDLREAGRARREAVARLADVAIGLLEQRGSGAAAHQGEVTATLEAASLDPQAGAHIAGGRLTTALDPPSGFGDLGAVAWGATDPPPATPDPQVDEPVKVASDATTTGAPTPVTRALVHATQAVTDAGRSATASVAAAREAVDAAARSEREVDEAEADLMRRQREIEDARRRVKELHRHADETRRAAAAAEAAATEAVEHLRRAEQHMDDLRARAGSP